MEASGWVMFYLGCLYTPKCCAARSSIYLCLKPEERKRVGLTWELGVYMVWWLGALCSPPVSSGASAQPQCGQQAEARDLESQTRPVLKHLGWCFGGLFY